MTGDERRSRRLRTVASAECAVVVALGGLALLGWAIGVPALTTFTPKGPTMVPLTAVGLIVAGLSTWLRIAEPGGRVRHAVALLGGLVALAIGLIVSAEYAFGVDLGADRLVRFREMAPPYPGRPSPPTAVGLALVGAAILAFDVLTRGGRRPAEWLACATGFIAQVALTGHLYGTGQLYLLARGSVIGVSIPTALALALLATAILLGRPTVGLMRQTTAATPGGALIRKLGAGAVLIPPLLGVIVNVAHGAGLRDMPLNFALLTTLLIPVGLTMVFVTARLVDRAHRELLESRERLEALRRATVALTDSLAALPKGEVAGLLQTIVLQARLLTNARYGALGIGDDPTRPFEPWVSSGMPEGVAAELGRFPRPVGVLGRVARDGEVVRVEDLSQEGSFGGLPPGHPSMKSFLGVPIQFGGRAFGNLYLADKEGAAGFSLDDQRVVQLLAARAGSALETAHAYRDEAAGRAWLQTVLDQMPEGVVILDETGRLAHINQAARLLAAPSATQPVDPLGNPWLFDAQRPNGEPVEWQDLPLTRAIMAKETVTGVELILRLVDGRLVRVLVNASPIQGEFAVAHGAVCVFRDIELMKEVQRLREEWTSVIAHDLRQPISVIALASGLLTNRPTDAPTAAKLVGRIARATKDLSRMIDDLLDASRIETRRLTIDARRLELAPALEEIIDRLGQTYACRVHLHVVNDTPAVVVDPGRLEQILTNLVSNAARYGEPGADILVSAEPDDDQVAISVTNRGRGLQPAEIANLFTRFYRTPDARTRPEGLGLGLYIVKGLVEAHGGRISVASTPGAVTTFRFTLPTVTHAAETAAPPPRHEEEHPPGP